jgi:DNA-binding GntR family transcriptional regulator
MIPCLRTAPFSSGDKSMADFRTDTQKVTDALREAVLAGEFRPGDRLPQRTIAERFHTTTIVAREALRALTGEGLVILEPRFGAMVQEISEDRLEQRYIVREALEGMAARLAARHFAAADGVRLRELSARCDRELPSDLLDSHTKAELHVSLHEAIIRLSRCAELESLLGGILLHSVIASNAYHIDWTAILPDAHARLVEPIIAGDEDAAERIMRRHVRDGLANELEAIRRGGTA